MAWESHGGGWDQDREARWRGPSTRRSRPCSRTMGIVTPHDSPWEAPMSSTDLASNLADDERQDGQGPLGAIFTPASVAVVGATEKAGSVGRTILQNLV